MSECNRERDLILYDFCGTIADFQTGNAFVRFVLKKKNMQGNLCEKIRLFLNRIGFVKHFNYIFPQMAINKFLLLYQLKGIRYEELDKLAQQYYVEHVRPHLIGKVLDTIERHRSEGALIVLDSAGYEIYLKYFIEEYHIPVLLASEFEYRNGVFTGHLIGKDNYGYEKVRRLDTYFGNANFTSGFASVVGYSDSCSDLPVLEHCNQVICVNEGAQPEKWMVDIGADIICY